MQIIYQPATSALDKLQQALNQEMPEGIVDIWGNAPCLYLVEEDVNSIIAVMTINIGDGVAEIYKLYVAPSHRNNGIAKKLFKKALQHLHEIGTKEIFIEIASTTGLTWFQSATTGMHFDEIDTNKYIIHLDTINNHRENTA